MQDENKRVSTMKNAVFNNISWVQRYRIYAVSFFIVFFSVGLTGTILPATNELFLKLFPLALLLSFAALLLFLYDPSRKQFIFIALLYLTTWLVEVAGVLTGKIFGYYEYGSSLGLKILGTPLIIGLNWVMLTIISASLADQVAGNNISKIIFASFLMVLYDLLLEQVAPLLDMWTWENGTVPVKNYLAWLSISVMIHSALRYTRISFRSSLAFVILACQLMFFLVLYIFKTVV